MKRGLLLAGCAAALFLAGCGDDDSTGPSTETPTAEATTTSTTATTAPAATAPDDSAPSDTTPPDTAQAPTTTAAAPPTTAPALEPGEPCEVGTVDCVEDAWGDGVARTIVGYDECFANVGDSGLCEDLDEDGHAGYPDSG